MTVSSFRFAFPSPRERSEWRGGGRGGGGPPAQQKGCAPPTPPPPSRRPPPRGGFSEGGPTLPANGREGKCCGSTRRMPPPEGGLAAAGAGQIPHAGAARVLVGGNFRIAQIGPAGRGAGAHRGAEIGGAIDGHALDAGRARHGGEVGIIGLAGRRMLEVGRELAPPPLAPPQ